jgi:hypothetical protein
MDSLPLYRDKLYCDDVFRNFQEIITKVKQSTKPELKAHAESLKEALFQAREKALENYEAANVAQIDQKSKNLVLSLDLSLDNQVSQQHEESDANISEEEELVCPKVVKKEKCAISDRKFRKTSDDLSPEQNKKSARRKPKQPEEDFDDHISELMEKTDSEVHVRRGWLKKNETGNVPRRR